MQNLQRAKKGFQKIPCKSHRPKTKKSEITKYKKKQKNKKGRSKNDRIQFYRNFKKRTFSPSGLVQPPQQVLLWSSEEQQQDNNDNKINCDKDKNISDNDNYDKDKKNLSDDNKNDNNSHVTGALRYFHYVWPFIHSSMLAS